MSQILGCASTDVACCTSENINKWAKYKPVHLPNVTNADQIKIVNGIITWKKESELGGARPWWYGRIENPAMGIPKIERMSDAESPWKYNGPLANETSPCRIGDFLYYKHNARCAFKVSVPLAYNNSNQIVLGNTYSYGIWFDSDEDADEYTLTVEDVCKMNNMLVNFHIATFVRVKNDYGVFTGCVASRQPIGDILRYSGDDYNFHIVTTKEGTIRVYGGEESNPMDSGVITTIKENDEVTVYICLVNANTSQLSNVTNLNGEALEKYSAHFEDGENVKCMKQYVVSKKNTDIITNVDSTYTVSAKGSITTPSLSGYKYYIDDEDNIYEVSRFFNLNTGGTVTIKPSTQVPNVSVTIGLVANARISGSPVRKMPYVVLNRSEGVTLYTSGHTFNLSLQSFSTVLYKSQVDALNKANGRTFNNGMPIFDKIVYNAVDAEAIGTIPTTNAVVECFASGNDGISLNLTSTNKTIMQI